MIKLIVGLGNPGEKYENTRHNVGFMAVDALLHESPARSERMLQSSLLFESEKYGWIGKPLTFMNRSGRAVAGLMRELDLLPHQVLVIYDDFALELGLIRIRQRGSAGGHNGLESIVETLQTIEVPRIRLGIETPDMDGWADFVLGRFLKKEQPVVEEMIERCVDAVNVIFSDGIHMAMNRFNKKQANKEQG